MQININIFFIYAIIGLIGVEKQVEYFIVHSPIEANY
jgi:hypothetical protein